MRRFIFVSGGTGFVGRELIGRLVARGHRVRALARSGSEAKLPRGCEWAPGDPLSMDSFRHRVEPADTFIHLVGTPKPAPWKGAQFRAIDLVSLRQSVEAAREAGIGHFVFLSVAQPAPVMKAYIQVRQECEHYIAQAGLKASILRPWYVLGPGRFWPLALMPFYKLGEALGAEGAQRLGLLRQEEMTRAMVWAVENPGARILDVPSIRRAASCYHQ